MSHLGAIALVVIRSSASCCFAPSDVWPSLALASSSSLNAQRLPQTYMTLSMWLQLPIKERKLNIAWLSRQRSMYNSRAVVNEMEAVASLREHYGPSAVVRMLHFSGSLAKTMQDLSDVDILIGMHGAGADCVCCLC